MPSKLLQKHARIADRIKLMDAMGAVAVGPINERILSPTRAIIGGRETVLAGTNNYMGITFEEDCIAAGQKALEEFGNSAGGKKIEERLHADLERLEAIEGERPASLLYALSCGRLMAGDEPAGRRWFLEALDRHPNADFTQQDEIRWTDRVVVLAGTMADGTFTVTAE